MEGVFYPTTSSPTPEEDKGVDPEEEENAEITACIQEAIAAIMRLVALFSRKELLPIEFQTYLRGMNRKLIDITPKSGEMREPMPLRAPTGRRLIKAPQIQLTPFDSTGEWTSCELTNSGAYENQLEGEAPADDVQSVVEAAANLQSVADAASAGLQCVAQAAVENLEQLQSSAANILNSTPQESPNRRPPPSPLSPESYRLQRERRFAPTQLPRVLDEYLNFRPPVSSSFMEGRSRPVLPRLEFRDRGRFTRGARQ
ncbi:hypothetical protein J437_LFUL007229 [Ladona fulva]|uniref:Uncharacterized protein n=1 Tax=Ladona fulva TaxID=123851 RepID=A0A8K0K5U2_LADFU|nr:hypothetical protein J437_LFUL007229 [Ladona fulva]